MVEFSFFLKNRTAALLGILAVLILAGAGLFDIPVLADSSSSETQQLISYHYDLPGYCVRCSDVEIGLSALSDRPEEEWEAEILNHASIQIRLSGEDSDPEELWTIDGLAFDFGTLAEDLAVGTVSEDGYRAAILLPVPSDHLCSFLVYVTDDTESGPVSDAADTPAGTNGEPVSAGEGEEAAAAEPVQEVSPAVPARDLSGVLETAGKIGSPLAAAALAAASAMLVSDIQVLRWYRSLKRRRGK